jgi:gliding motility-associated-like protein
MSSKPYSKTAAVVAFLLLLLSIPSWAQLKADFTIDKPGGCAPHAVSFTNTSTGTSSSTTYTWSFGNGNSSTLRNPGATYNEEKKYTVTLTAKDGAQTSTKTLEVTVYKKPEVSFDANLLKGCAPLPIELTSSSTAGDGSISNYFWDFGDGGLQQGSNLKTVSHTYQSVQKASVSLTVTNSHGCYRTLEKTALVEILGPISAGFSVPDQTVCKVDDPVSFSNSSSGPGTLGYTWNFGDGSTSTSLSPTHTYNKKGKFPAQLTVSNEFGCTATSAPLTISVADFAADFEFPALVCNNSSFELSNTSNPAPTSVSWTADDGSEAYSYGNTPVSFSFFNPGKRKLTMTARFGTCVQIITKEVDVKTGPELNGFTVDLGTSCGAPTTVIFKDTTTGSTSWNWSVNYGPSFGSTKEASYTFQNNGGYTVGLKVKNAQGCESVMYRSIDIFKPVVSILLLQGATSGCINLRNKFGSYSSEEIVAYDWDFGDGTKSTEAEPVHVFSKEGSFTVKLNYTTKSGCNGTESTLVVIDQKPEADFSTDPLVVCGNTPALFTNLTTGRATRYVWDFSDYGPTSYPGTNAVHQFQNEGVYSIQLIAFNGNCSDTMRKENYVEIKPGFPDISFYSNTCENTRGEVTVYQNSRQAETYTWDFGDGSTPVQWTTGQETIKHLYSKTGSYKIKLTITNGSCSVSDSIDAAVLLKQQPVLSSVTTELCSSSSIDIKVNGLENNPRPVTWDYGTHYNLEGLYFEDGSRYDGIGQSLTQRWTTEYNGRFRGLDPARKGIQVVLVSQYFGCQDTTNILPLLIKGPIADFKTTDAFTCFKDSIEFTDLSRSQNNIPIVKWEWSFGDTRELAMNSGDPVKHRYQLPGAYYAKLKVTDAEGCFHETGAADKIVQAYGPKADFDFNPKRVIPQTTVSFFSTSDVYPYNYVDYRWLFQNGSSDQGYWVNKYYPVNTTDTVRMIATDMTTGCTDTVAKVVVVKDVSAAFTYTTSYINNNSCPPVVASFINTSDNFQSVRWDFGNGRSAGNQGNVSSTYDLPGVYTVTLYAYGFNNAVDSMKIPIEIKGPYAILSADTIFGCQDLSVQLSAVVRNASSFTWDFGDGTLLQTTDTFAVHKYLSPGIYQPALIMKDPSGCAGTSRIDDKIVIDQLATSVKAAPALVCDSGFVQLDPATTSLAASELGLPLSYRWQSGHGQSSDAEQPSFYFNQPGVYKAEVEIVSPFGCTASSEVDITVNRITRAAITGPDAVCENAPVEFIGTADREGDLSWSWSLGNGTNSTEKVPGLIRYGDAGNYPVQLIVAHNGCRDTVGLNLTVHPNPVPALTPKSPILCLGDRIQLSVRDGVAYQWTAAEGLTNLTVPDPFIAPTKSTFYEVKVTNAVGCVAVDSTTVTVAQPIRLDLIPDTSVCRGFSVNLSVTGATTYQWISSEGLNSSTSPNPVANPETDARYVVVGYDQYNCFTDTAAVLVRVRELPTVDAGDDISLPTGEQIQLKPVYSADVVSYNWSPRWFLNCTTCPNPIAFPKDNAPFTITVQNQYGCVARDEIAFKLECSENVSIPNAFTPNNDGKNDRFNLMGKGIREVKSLRIYSRLGDVIFERTNFQIGERQAGWDGTIAGNPAAAGTYVYFAEFICDSGELFTRKGTIIVVR